MLLLPLKAAAATARSVTWRKNVKRIFLPLPLSLVCSSVLMILAGRRRGIVLRTADAVFGDGGIQRSKLHRKPIRMLYIHLCESGSSREGIWTVWTAAANVTDSFLLPPRMHTQGAN